jgi:hypothetical protein
VPHCIKHFPGEILDVVMSTIAEPTHGDISIATSGQSPSNEQGDNGNYDPYDSCHPDAIVSTTSDMY